ncbi:MAG: VWA domain-containing protein [Deltaproteobacteria bacterium]|nr:VWA domain-containing protein [Deltaproteobacteria bacterium]
MMSQRLLSISATLIAATAWLLTPACSVGDGSTFAGGLDDPGSSGSGGSSSGDIGFGGSNDDPLGNGGACSAVVETADNQIQPADIILAIDQSGSMDQETNWVTSQLNGFAAQITGSGIDVHVVVIAGKPGSENGFCVPAPLASGGCPDDNNLPTFLHVDQHVDSHDAFQQILTRYNDYAQMLRPDAAKHVVVISDDDSNMGAAAFDAALKALDPSFADYVFHAIACEHDNGPCADESDQYWNLVVGTGGVFGELADQNFGPVWDAVSQQVIQDATLACQWDIPAPPDGEQFVADLVNVLLSINGAPAQALGQVSSAADCATVNGGWYYDDPTNPTKILVCPDVCQQIQGADAAEVNIEFGCQTTPAAPN